MRSYHVFIVSIRVIINIHFVLFIHCVSHNMMFSCYKQSPLHTKDNASFKILRTKEGRILKKNKIFSWNCLTVKNVLNVILILNSHLKMWKHYRELMGGREKSSYTGLNPVFRFGNGIFAKILFNFQSFLKRKITLRYSYFVVYLLLNYAISIK